VSVPQVSVVVVAFNMARELPRTLRSLSRELQRGVADLDYEVIVVDNGSSTPVGLPAWPEFTVVRVHDSDASRSPASAVNRGIERARGELIGVLIDGARIASPGVIAQAALASRVNSRALIYTLGFHLGPEIQTRSVPAGYDHATEDALLDSVDWESDPYRLFSIAALAGSSANGWFMPVTESNALFMRREMWSDLGGYDERFQSVGGGFVNLDLFERALRLPDVQPVLLLGEATFHQVHGGVATNAPNPPFDEFAREYQRIRGHEFVPPQFTPLCLGTPTEHAMASVAWSAERARQSTT
jgi:glycosyltransferase involved in cell wall biosynthesis